MSATVTLPASGASVGALLSRASAELDAAGCQTPRLDAEVLLAHVLGCSRGTLLAERDMLLGADRAGAYAAAIRRRSRDREPVAYITGTRGFRHIELRVDRRALIPRPESELLVEAALSLAPGTRVLDLGTGSGALALALRAERPDLDVVASDVCVPALALARENAARLGLELDCRHADLLCGIPDEFDALVANPPYVGTRERSALAPEILRHEPALALFAGADGLDVIRALASQLVARPRVRWVALEIGARQGPAVRELFRAASFTSLRLVRDLAGIERVLVATREG